MKHLKAIFVVIIIVLTTSSNAGVIFGTDGNLGGGSRWNADHYIHNGLERSLDGGLRYSMQGGSFEAYRDAFVWDTIPSISDFTTAIKQSFNAWTVPDPFTGLTTSLSFINDSDNTTAVGNGFATVNVLGAEIDLLASNAGGSGMRGTAYFNASSNNVTLTSGTTNYANSYSIIGADINMNNNVGTVWSLDWFTRILTHEIGHAIGMGDLEDAQTFGFIDDNFDPNDPVGTLNNSWALQINPLNPADSIGLSQYFNLTPNHLTNAGVDLLMESRGVGVGPNNPLENLMPLTNDEYATRQFLYPTFLEVDIPEPSTLIIFGLGILALRLNRKST
ncbi:PEP-CTERM sorting domain-containing protein [Thalassotalea sp. M1531]|uniref:PEP-CTERM sorting domain-containing protein n=1 Tax=Thalassotalea algicola TaxID=2716224 RepID=A0A7Y0LCZ9_9GAMM|nr:PEP-CTERM sorting domain-containing protein [Thalassotalea algicola]NMP31904.1 PEP-CTERM sorting domain-containing protein [Thalassotalea algicola]